MTGQSVGYILSILLLGLSFLLKLFVDRKTNIPLFISSLLELPVDINFLGLSFIIAYIIKQPTNISSGFIDFFIYLFVSVLTIFLWRKATNMFDKGNNWITFGLGSLNFLISVYMMLESLSLITTIQQL